MYRGAANYHKHLTKRTDVMDKKMTHGPIRATANVRTITVMDYQPDVCKDYKETGFCGYGDSCKFLHDRGDYLAGWQMDKVDPNSGQPVVDEEDEEEEVPFACLLCRQPFTDPIITKCGHYFCMQYVFPFSKQSEANTLDVRSSDSSNRPSVMHVEQLHQGSSTRRKRLSER